MKTGRESYSLKYDMRESADVRVIVPTGIHRGFFLAMAG
jgi:hypothetical protein